MSIPMIYELEMWIPHWGSGASDLSESRKTSTCPSRWQTCPSTLFITPAEMIWYCGTNPCSVGRCPNSSFSPGMHRAAFLCFGVGQGAKSSGQGQATVNGNYMDNTCATLMITWTILDSIDNTWAPIGTYMDHLEQCWGNFGQRWYNFHTSMGQLWECIAIFSNTWPESALYWNYHTCWALAFHKKKLPKSPYSIKSLYLREKWIFSTAGALVVITV